MSSAKKKPRGGLAPANWQAHFLTAFEASGNVTYAARKCGVRRGLAYTLRERDPEFAKSWLEAEEIACDGLELEARRRAVQGCEKPVFQGGKQVGTIREYSDLLLIFLLKGHRPWKYRDRYNVEMSGAVNVDLLLNEAWKRSENL